MATDRERLAKNVTGNILNLGCGFDKMVGATNVDAFSICEPDIIWDLNKTPWLWAKDEEYDVIYAHHIFEHLDHDKWWNAFKEVARILKKDGFFEMRVPDHSSKTAIAWRDHNTLFCEVSFHGIIGTTHSTNAWAKTEEASVPLQMVNITRVPFHQYNWMRRFPRLLNFCANHLVNFIWEQRFLFHKR